MKREERMTYFIMTNWTWNQAQAFIQVLNHWPMKILGCVALKTKSIHGTFERGLSTENNHTFFVAEGFQTRWSRSEWSSLLTVTMWRETKVKSVQIFKPDCSDMDMTQFIFISVQSSFPAHAFKYCSMENVSRNSTKWKGQLYLE